MEKIRVNQLLLSFGALTCIQPIFAAEHQNQDKKRPNIIFLLTDDHRYDAMGCMGNNIIHTPNMDDLAAHGLKFTNAYVTTSISCCSRASILTGQYVARHGVRDFNTALKNPQQSYPLIMKQHGYNIGFVGKYGVGAPNKQPKELYDFWTCEKKGQPDYENKDRFGNYYHHTDQLNREIAQFLDNFAYQDKPFCLSVSFKAPHTQDGDKREFITHPRYDSYYENVVIPPAKNGTIENWNQYPESFRTKNEARARWNNRFSTPEKYQKHVKNYYRLITQIDDVIGDMRKQLERLNIADNTIIVLMGDNGFFLGEHGMAGKWYIYNESVRVPLLIYSPQFSKKQKGKAVDKMVLNIDIAPTLLGFAGIDTPDYMQGRDIMNCLDKHIPWRHEFFYEHHLPHPYIPKSEGVVSDDYKYVNYYDRGYDEFYDLRNDPDELHNLINDPEVADKVAYYRKHMEDLKSLAK